MEEEVGVRSQTRTSSAFFSSSLSRADLGPETWPEICDNRSRAATAISLVIVWPVGSHEIREARHLPPIVSVMESDVEVFVRLVESLRKGFLVLDIYNINEYKKI